ncbi:MAG TPA: peptide MFS transporter [Bryobacteraceae bacterium]|nr:peptide MFS transporter [Bryobacteraceae bacterium]
MPVNPAIPIRPEATLWGHPRGLTTLFFTEMWERFSFYGMRALLILFMTASVERGGLGFATSEAGIIYGLYTAMVYMTALPGGWLADQFLGQRRAVLYGGIIIAMGHFTMAVPSLTTFYSGLCLIVIGTGLLKPNISVIVGQLYGREDTRRDAGFSIFYMGINLGAFLAPLACGYVGQRVNWHWGFGLAGIGMTIGVAQYMLGWKHLGTAGLAPAPPKDAGEAASRKKYLLWGTAACATLAIVCFLSTARGLISARAVADASGVVLVSTVVVFFGWLFSSSSWTSVERKRLIVVAVLFLAAALFWSVFEQAGSTLNLFAERNTDNRAFGFEFPASWYQSINSMFIITLAPVFAWLWLRLGRREPSSPMKFVLALILVGAGFAIMAGAAVMGANGVRVSPWWLICTYLLHTMGELCLSPVGLSAMTKLAPVRVGGLMMGVWFLSLSAGEYIGGRLASHYESFPLPMLFGVVAAFAAGAGLLLWMMVRPTERLMGGVK